MKLIIQIPCLDEAATLPATLADLPAQVSGFDAIEVLVIDDGSRDGTADVALAHGADRVVRLSRRRGLAQAFARGLAEAREMRADVVVNTDGDHQYPGHEIARLVRPIVAERVDLVVGGRNIETIEHFPSWKKPLERLGSRLVRWATGCPVTDAASGFRAYGPNVIDRLRIESSFSHTLETLFQAKRHGWIVRELPIATNPKTRESRLARHVPDYLLRSFLSLGEILVHHRPSWLLGHALPRAVESRFSVPLRGAPAVAPAPDQTFEPAPEAVAARRVRG